ncbi:MAG: Amuc_1100 family pilus-like protein [Candidatus Omnitrophica bacterium]|nr:Amuc_1100 family pilus-like protein [Candidatus Omnitrophota bacterium]
MDGMIVKKFKGPIIAVAVMTVIGAVVAVAILAGMGGNARLERRAEVLEETVKADARIYGADPETALDRQSAVLMELNGRYAELRNLFRPDDNAAAQTPITPLSFKQRLFSVSDAMQKRAKPGSVIIPELLGFSDYAFNVPEPELVPVLTRELAVVEEVVGMLLDSKVDAINSLTLKHKPMNLTRPVSDSETISFPATSLNVVFETDYPRMQKFLSGLNRSRNMYIIRQLELKRKEPLSARLVAAIELESVMWE